MLYGVLEQTLRNKGFPIRSGSRAAGDLWGTNMTSKPLTVAIEETIERARNMDASVNERLKVIADGVTGTLQPAFAMSAGGTLTDAQVDALVTGLVSTWGKDAAVKTSDLPSYAASPGDAGRGQGVYAAACAGCHGPEGKGGPKGGSVVDASFLALASDQYLRTVVIAGRTDLGMPDWRGYTPGPLTEKQISDVVAWLIAQRRPVPGRPNLPKEG